MKKTIALVLSLVLILGCINITTVNAAPSTNEYDYTKLVNFGLLSGNIEGFTDKDNITRGEMANIAVKFSESSKAADLYTFTGKFSDVPSTHEFAKEIEMAASLGIISGVDNTTFLPDDYVTYNQAIKMILEALGYGFLANHRGGYPNGYLYEAARVGLTEGVDITGYYITRKDLAMFLENTFDIKPVTMNAIGGTNVSYAEEERAIRSRLGITDGTGVVSSNEFTSLTSTERQNAGYVMINGIKMELTNKDDRNLIGHKVDYFYKYNKQADKNTLLYITPASDIEVLTVYAEDVIDADPSTNVFKYYTDASHEEDEQFTIPRTTPIIYNNQYSNDAVTFTDLNIDTGYIKFIDNDGDNNYDYIFVSEYRDIIVSGVATGGKYFTDLYKRQNVSYDDTSKSSVIAIYKYGSKYFTDRVAIGDVLTVYESKSGQIVDIYISTNGTVKGTITEIDNNKVLIGDVWYKVSSDYINLANKGVQGTTPITIGLESSFYLNHYGEIVGVSSQAGLFNSEILGFVTKTGVSEGVDKYVEVRIFTQNNEFVNYKMYEGIEIDGSTKNSSNATYTLADIQNVFVNQSTGLFEPQLVRFKANSKGEITMLDTQTVNTSKEDPNTSLRLDQQSTATTNYFYLRTMKGIFNYDESTYYFKIPRNPDLTFNVDEEKQFVAGKAIEANGSTKIGDWSAYYYKAYNISDYMSVAAALVISPTTQTATVPNTQPLSIFDRVTDCIDENGMNTKMVYYYNHKGEKVSAMLDLDYKFEDGSKGTRTSSETYTFDDLKRGDLFRVSVNSTTKHITGVQLILKINDHNKFGKEVFSRGFKDNEYMCTYRVRFGKVVAVNAGARMVELAYPKLDANGDFVLDAQGNVSLLYANESYLSEVNMPVYKYDSVNDKIIKTSLGELSEYYSTKDYSKANSLIFDYSYQKIYLMYVVE